MAGSRACDDPDPGGVSGRLGVVLYYRRQNRYGLAAVAGALEGDPGLAGLDLRFVRREEDLPGAIEDAARLHGRVLLGVSFFTAQAPAIGELVRALKERLGERLFLAAGGPHPSGDPAGTLGLGFDAVAVGEGEATFRELVRTVARGEALDGVRGLAIPDGQGGMRRTGRRPPIDLDAWPPWCGSQRKFGPIEITRGCPYGCTFCQATTLCGGRVRHRSVPVVVEHVVRMCRRGMPDVRFITPDAFAYGSPDGRELVPEALEELLARVREAAGESGRVYFGSFPSEVRPEHVTPEVLAIVRRYAANDNLVFGAQSGSPRMLEATRRGHSVEDVRRAVELAVRAGFVCYVDFIFGLPGETPDDEAATIRLMGDLVERGAVLHAHTFMPLPGTPLAGAPPGRIGPRLRERVRELIAAGRLFGEWHRQERLPDPRRKAK